MIATSDSMSTNRFCLVVQLVSSVLAITILPPHLQSSLSSVYMFGCGSLNFLHEPLKKASLMMTGLGTDSRVQENIIQKHFTGFYSVVCVGGYIVFYSVVGL